MSRIEGWIGSAHHRDTEAQRGKRLDGKGQTAKHRLSLRWIAGWDLMHHPPNEELKMRSATLLILLSLLLTPIVCAPSTSTSSTNQAGTTVEPTITQYSLTPEKLQKAEALYKVIAVFVTLSTIYGFVVLLGLLRFDIGPKFRN